MVQSCCIVGCKERKVRGSKLRLFRYPSPNNVQRYEMWIKATCKGRAPGWSPSKYSSVCEKHFQTGAPVKDPDHPDYVPNVFSYSTRGKRSAQLYDKRKMRRIDRQNRKEAEEVKTVLEAPRVVHQRASEPLVVIKEEPMEECSEDLSNVPYVITTEHVDIHDITVKTEETQYNEITNQSEEEEPQPSREELFTEFNKLVVQNHNLTQCNLQLKNENASLQDIIKNLKNKYEEADRRALIIENLLQQNETLTSQLQTLQEELNARTELIDTNVLLSQEDRCKFYTGLPNRAMFHSILVRILPQINLQRTNKTFIKDKRLLALLMKLKLNLIDQDLAFRFNCSESLIKTVYRNWVPALSSVLGSTIPWPGRENIINIRPECFNGTPCENCLFIIDSLEIKIRKHSSLPIETLVFLIVYAPNGTILSIAQCWEGSHVLKFIPCELFNYLQQDDVVLVKKEFIFMDELEKSGISIVSPPFELQQNDDDNTNSNNELSLNDYFKRVIGQMKQFKLLMDTFPFASNEASTTIIVNAVHACAALVNAIINPVNVEFN